MKVKRMVKRLFAVGTGVAMLGATAMGALAADLSDYRTGKLFVTADGTFDGLLVVGENAASVDNLALTDIAANMKYAKSGTAAVSTALEGDAWLVGTSSQKYEMADSATTSGSITGETVTDIQTSIGKDELGGLAGGTYATGEGTYAYEQYLYFDEKNKATNEIVKFVEDDSDPEVTDTFFYVKNGQQIARYVLEFTSNAESTIQDTAGSVSSSGTVLDDYEDTTLTMLGRDYTVVLARRPQSVPQNSIKLTLMGGAASGSLLEGETTTLNAAGKEYEVSVSYVDSTYAKLTVNGEQTQKLQKGDTYKLSDGNEVGVSEVLYQSYAGGIHSADFFIGANKVELRDNDITNASSGNQQLSIGGDTVSGTDVVIEGTDDNTTFRLSRIAVNMTAQDDYYVGPGSKLSAAIVGQSDDKELLFTENWDVEFTGLSSVETHDVKIQSSGDRKYVLNWYDGDNNLVKMPLAYADDSDDISMSNDGKSGNRVWVNENTSFKKNDWFVLSAGDSAAGSGKSYLLQYKGGDALSDSDPKFKFRNEGSGETLEYTVGTSNPRATIKLGGYSFIVHNETTGKDFDIYVDLNGDGTINAENITTNASNQQVGIVDYYGLNISFEGNLTTDGRGLTVDNFTLVFTTDNSNDYDNQAPSTIEVDVNAAATNQVNIRSFTVNGTSNPLLTPQDEENVAYGYTTMGGKLTYTTPSSSPEEFTYGYPADQRLPMVYVTSGATSSSAVASGDLAKVEVGVATKLDSEVADVEAQNLLVVGGPCVNSVAAELMGNPAVCTEGFTPGKAVVKLFEHSNGKVAMLVAGYSGMDTRLAGKVVAQQPEKLSGKEVEVEGTTLSNVKVGAPTVVESTSNE